MLCLIIAMMRNYDDKFYGNLCCLFIFVPPFFFFFFLMGCCLVPFLKLKSNAIAGQIPSALFPGAEDTYLIKIFQA